MVKVANLKLAFVHPDLGIGGAERLVVDVAVALKSQGVQVQFLTNHFDSSHAFDELKNGQLPVHVIGDWLPRHIFGIFQAVCAYFRMLYLSLVYCFFMRFVTADSPDVYFVDQIPMAVPILKWTGKRVIYYCHHPDLLASPEGGSLRKFYRYPLNWLEEYGTSKADVILVNSKYTKEIFLKTFTKIAKNDQTGQNLRILYPTIASSFLDDIQVAKKRPLHEIAPEIETTKPDDVVFLSINRYHPAKQLELAIEAMAKLRDKLAPEEYHRVHLIMAGGYDPQSTINATYFRKLVNLTHQHDLIVKVVFLKSPSDKLKAELLKTADVLIYTPTNEHFGIVPLEAMAAKKAVIACNSGGPRETVDSQVTGYLCEPSADKMAECMKRCLKKEAVKKMGEKGCQRLNQLFSYEVFKKECMEIVTNLYEAK